MINPINSLKSLLNKTEQDFSDRKEGQASTSKYIQANVPTEDGVYKKDPQKGTPDDEIVKPNLKEKICETVSLMLPGLPSIPTLPSIPDISTLKTMTASMMENIKNNINSKIDAISSVFSSVSSLSPDSASGIPSMKKTKMPITIKETLHDKDKAEYGKIFVNETKGGFVELKDETPGNKTWKRLHPSGTYKQTLNSGNTQEKIVDDFYLLVDKNWNIAIGKDFVEVIDGNNKIQIKKGKFESIQGDNNSNIEGSSYENIEGNKSEQVGNSSTEYVKKNKYVDVSGNLSELVEKNKNTMTVGSERHIVTKDKNDIITGSLNIMTFGNVSLSSATGNINLNATNINFKGIINILGMLKVNGVKVNVP